MKMSRLLPIFLVVFVDILGFGLILPLLPFYAKTYGADAFVAGLLVAIYPLGQLISAPILGRLSDRFGRKPVLIFSIAGTVISLLTLGFANALWLLFVARAVDGLTGGNITIARAYITDVTDDSNRARGLGLIGAAFGLGFVVGPAIGALLSTWGFGVPAFAAAGLAFVNWLAVVFRLPESLTEERRAELAARPQRARFSIDALVAAMTRPRVGSLLLIGFLFALPSTMFQSTFPIYADYQLGLDELQTGLVLTYVGVVVAIIQGGLVGIIAKRFDDLRLMLATIPLMGISLAGWAFAFNVPLLLLVLLPLSFASGIFTTVNLSALSKAVASEEVGGTIGIAASLESLTRVIGPTLGGYLIARFGSWSPGVFGAAVLGLTTVYALLNLPRQMAGPPAADPASSGD